MTDTPATENEPKPSAEKPEAETFSVRRFEDLPPAAQRALGEAEERRARMKAEEAAKPREIGGRGGKDPVRYGDWEVKGVAVDF
ncbi:MAG: DUF1674 domain-containing protein [Oricola sp.]